MLKNIQRNLYVVIGILMFLIFLLLIWYLNQVNSSKVLSPRVVIMEETIEISKGNKVSLLAYVENVSDYKIEWSSSDINVAIIDQNGVINGLASGTSTITATYRDNNGNIYTDNCLVNVVLGSSVSINNVKFFGDELVISENNELKLMPIISPNDATYTSIKYSSSDNKVATITDKGLLKAIGVGRTCITVVVDDKYTDEMYVNVTSENGIMEYVTLPNKLSFKEEKVNLSTNDVVELHYEYLPIESDVKYLKWTSSNSEVVSVSNGVINGIKEGEAIITVTSLNGVNAKINISVKRNTIDVTGISLTATSTKLIVGDTLQLTYQVFPTDATNKSVTFKSSDESIATVSNTGLVTAKKKGTATITVTSNNGKSRSVDITVTARSSGGSGSGSGRYCSSSTPTLTYNGDTLYDEDKITMKKGEEITLTVNLPTSCGEIILLTRTTASGQSDWQNYFSAHSDPFVDRYNINTAIKTTSYNWVIKANKITNGYVTLSQTAEMQTTSYTFVKPMIEIGIKVTN